MPQDVLGDPGAVPLGVLGQTLYPGLALLYRTHTPQQGLVNEPVTPADKRCSHVRTKLRYNEDSQYCIVVLFNDPVSVRQKNTGHLTIPMQRRLLSNAQGFKDFWKTSKPCHVGIHWIALTEYSHMNTHLPGFQSFFSIFASFCIGQISHHQHKGYVTFYSHKIT